MQRVHRLLCVIPVVLLLAASGGCASAARAPAAAEVVSPELRKLSDLVQHFQNAAEKELGIAQVYVGGGSSRAILDHLYFGKPLDMRDIDVFLVADQEVTEEYSRKLGLALEGPVLGKFSAVDLRPRPRGNPEVPFPRNYNAGYGFFWIDENGRTFDLSIFHSEKDLVLNGIFNIDMVMLPVTKNQSIAELAERIAKVAPETVSASGLIRDSRSGYTDWIKNEARLVNEAEIIRDPSLQTIRSIRTYSKLKKTVLPKDFLEFLKRILKTAPPANRLQMARNLLKLFEDGDAPNEFKMLIQTGAIQGWSSDLQNAAARMKDKEVRALFVRAKAPYRPRGSPKALGILLGLFDRLNPSEAIILLNDLYKSEPQSVIAKVRGTLHLSFPNHSELVERLAAEMEACFQAKTCVSVLAHATGSEVLPEADRASLAVRAFLVDVPAEKRSELFAHLTRGALGEWETFKGRWMPKRIGYYSGVFNPIHLGHVDVIHSAIRDMALDEVVLMPTPATTHNEVPLPWETRVELANLAFENNPSVRVVDASYLDDFQAGTGVAIDRLFRENEGANFTHIMGSDSFERYLNRFGESELYKKSIYVVTRDVSREDIRKLSNHEKIYVGNPIEHASAGGNELERSSSIIRKRLDAGQSIDGLVSPAVEKYIHERHLYRNPVDLQRLRCNDILHVPIRTH